MLQTFNDLCFLVFVIILRLKRYTVVRVWLHKAVPAVGGLISSIVLLYLFPITNSYILCVLFPQNLWIDIFHNGYQYSVLYYIKMFLVPGPCIYHKNPTLHFF